jgi:hypothetical protein
MLTEAEKGAFSVGQRDSAIGRDETMARGHHCFSDGPAGQRRSREWFWWCPTGAWTLAFFKVVRCNLTLIGDDSMNPLPGRSDQLRAQNGDLLR